MKILIINGSHRKGNTDIAIEKVSLLLKKKFVEVRVLTLRDIEIKLPDGCETCGESGCCPNIKDQFSEDIEPTIRDYDIYVIATPAWSDNVTPLTKIFWDRIVSWCSEEKLILKGKKLAVITHGMAGKDSWKHIISWVESVCVWEQCFFAGSLTFSSGSKIGDFRLGDNDISSFVYSLLE